MWCDGVVVDMKWVEYDKFCSAELVSAVIPLIVFISHTSEVIFTSLDEKTDVEAIVAC